MYLSAATFDFLLLLLTIQAIYNQAGGCIGRFNKNLVLE